MKATRKGGVSRRAFLLSLVLEGVFCAVFPALALGVPFNSVALFCFAFLPIVYPLSLPSMPFRLFVDPAEGFGLCVGYVLGGLWLWLAFRCVRHANASLPRIIAVHVAFLVFAGWCWWIGMRMEGDWMEGGSRKSAGALTVSHGTALPRRLGGREYQLREGSPVYSESDGGFDPDPDSDSDVEGSRPLPPAGGD